MHRSTVRAVLHAFAAADETPAVVAARAAMVARNRNLWRGDAVAELAAAVARREVLGRYARPVPSLPRRDVRRAPRRLVRRAAVRLAAVGAAGSEDGPPTPRGPQVLS